MERLRFHDAVVEQSPTGKFQFQHHPKLKFVNLRSWYVDKTEFSLLKSLLWKYFFLFISFLSESIWYVGSCEVWYFGSSCFVTVWVIILLLHREAEMRTNCSITRQTLMMGGEITLMSCNPLSDARMSLFCFQVVLFRDNSLNLALKFCHVMSFYALHVSFEQIYYAFAKKLHKLFWARLKQETFAFVGKWLEHLKSREILCVACPNFLTDSAGPVYKILREWIWCLYNNVIDRLAWRQINQQLTKGNRRCISILVN